MQMKFIALALTTPFLSACDDPLPPTAGIASYNAARANYNAFSALPASTLPSTGSGTYTGKMSADANVDFKTGYAIVGDLELEIDFAESSDNISGTIDNINLIDRSTTNNSQQFTGADTETPGSLTISGTEVNGSLSATATGSLSAVIDGPTVATTAVMNLQLTGNTRTDTTTADTVTGTITGGGSGTTFNGMDVEISNGSFYGNE
jgi:hypothetical protein